MIPNFQRVVDLFIHVHKPRSWLPFTGLLIPGLEWVKSTYLVVGLGLGLDQKMSSLFLLKDFVNKTYKQATVIPKHLITIFWLFAFEM